MHKTVRNMGTFTLLAMAAAAASAQASGSVTLYGLIDAGLEHADSGAVSVNRLSSGISAGSRWGLKGTEELSPGWKAIFTLESRFEADTGSVQNAGSVYTCGAPANCPGVVLTAPYTSLPGPTQAALLGGAQAVNDAAMKLASSVNSAGALFDRQAYVGLVTPGGAVLFGRQYTPGYEVLVKYNSFADGFAGSPAQLSQTTIRVNNALHYRAELGGFAGSLMWGMGGTEINRSERGSPQSGDDFYGLNLQYNTETYGFGAGYNRNNTVTYAAPTQSRKGLETMSLGGFYAMGQLKFFGSFLKAKNDNPVFMPGDVLGLVATPGATTASILATVGGQYIGRGDVDGLRGVVGPVNLKVFHLGLQWAVPTGTVQVAFNQAKDTARSAWATADAKVDQLGVAYLHKLSLRTQLYAGAAVANNKGQARAALGGAGYLGGLTTGQGVDSRVVQAGVRHAF